VKIISLEGTNYKRLKAIAIEPGDSNTVLITGKNGAGKTSVLDLIISVLKGKRYCPDKPIRTGEDSAEGIITTENWKIKRTFTEKGGSLTITNVDGMRAQSPQQLLDKIVGEISFDPMEFINMAKTEAGKKQQRLMLMKLAGLDFSDLDDKIATTKTERSDVRRDKERLEHEADAIAVTEDTPDEEVLMTELTEEMLAAVNHNNHVDSLKSGIETGRVNLASVKQEIKDIRDTVKQQEIDLAKSKQDLQDTIDDETRLAFHINEVEIEFKTTEAKNISEIQQNISDLEATNGAVRNKKEKESLQVKAKKEADKWRELGKKMKGLEQQKADRLAKAKMPVEGLSVSDDCVLYNGIPLSQEGGAKQLEVSMAIAMEKNPKLRVIVMKGNELDDDSLKVVQKLVKDKDYQLWLERWSGDESGIIIEDGSVKQ